MMDKRMERLTCAADTVRNRLGEAEIGIVLGSGLGGHVEVLEHADSIPYSEIPEFPVSTVAGHAGRWWAGETHGKRVYMMQGRFHAYEGFDLFDLTMYVRMMKLLGVRTMIITNAAGCVNTAWQPGDLMMISDMINYSGRNPLIGANLDEMGPRFPDMSEAFSKRLRGICREQAQKLGLNIREGVYMWFNGPTYETPAEIRMARILGADAVGMSTVPETIVARHCGIEVLGISCLTNMAAGILDQPLNHHEVLEVTERVKTDFRRLLDGVTQAL